MAEDKTIWFLITYDRKKLRMADMERFHDGEKAVDLYGERERQYADQPHMEVVLLGADTEDAIRVTHPTLFPRLRGRSLLHGGVRVSPALAEPRAHCQLNPRQE